MIESVTRRQLLSGALASALTSKTAANAAKDGAMSDTLPAAAHDFDFFIGDWNVHHRKLKRRLANDRGWLEFPGTATARKLLGGLGNIDENVIQLPEGTYLASTLRFYNPGAKLWSIYWLDGRDPKLDPPMTGRFDRGEGLFFGDDQFEGRPIRVRFTWSPLAANHCRWSQAFSIDRGATWETNWIMDFDRA